MPVSAATGFFPMRLTGDSPTGCAVETALTTSSSFSPPFLLGSLPFPHGKRGSRKTDKTNVTAAKSARTSALKYLFVYQWFNPANAADQFCWSCRLPNCVCSLWSRAACCTGGSGTGWSHPLPLPLYSLQNYLPTNFTSPRRGAHIFRGWASEDGVMRVEILSAFSSAASPPPQADSSPNGGQKGDGRYWEENMHFFTSDNTIQSSYFCFLILSFPRHTLMFPRPAAWPDGPTEHADRKLCD